MPLTVSPRLDLPARCSHGNPGRTRNQIDLIVRRIDQCRHTVSVIDVDGADRLYRCNWQFDDAVMRPSVDEDRPALGHQ